MSSLDLRLQSAVEGLAMRVQAIDECQAPLLFLALVLVGVALGAAGSVLLR